MSHIVKIETKNRDVKAVQQACRRLGIQPAVHDTFRLYNSSETGWGVRLRDWTYPVVCNTDTGEVAYDNFGGRWGQTQRLDEFLQRYAAEKTKLEARKQGYLYMEQVLDDRSIKITISGEGA